MVDLQTEASPGSVRLFSMTDLGAGHFVVRADENIFEHKVIPLLDNTPFKPTKETEHFKEAEPSKETDIPEKHRAFRRNSTF